MDNTQQNIGKILKEARIKRNLTQVELALRVGKKRSYISKLETEYANNIKFQTLKEIVEKGLGGEITINI